MKPIIEVKNIGKKYNINHQKGGYVTLRDIMTNAFKNPFAFLKTKTKDILGIETKEVFWALKDVNFEVIRGEVIGIIGRNGAGKSTLLKILSQITPPTTGEIRINGTVGSLLEVGTGFHPELTGRENIFLNGAILGMKKKDIERKFNEIVEFADIEKFLDTPVKYYSSGMYVRLAFSVAAHMDTDILIIDEVLAVGDAEFQKKCLGKMEDITKKEGRTILFVSHNIPTIEQLCKRCILLENGKLKNIGITKEILQKYAKKDNIIKRENKEIFFKKVDIINKNVNELFFKIGIETKNNLNDVQIALGIDNEYGQRITTIFSKLYNKKFDLKKGINYISCETKNLSLKPGVYNVDIMVENDYFNYHEENVSDFKINNFNFYPSGFIPQDEHGYLLVNQNWY
jgi:lipopolysaccharide transport system ATP-binding protein